jgi:hypothetical protein
VEGRATNGSLQLIFTFDQPVTSGTVELSTGPNTIGVITQVSGNTITVALSQVADQQSLTLTVSGVDGSSNSQDISFGVLYGDVDGNGAVNSQDLVAVRNALGEQSGVAGFNPADDPNKDGAVNSQDLVAVRNALGNQIPP